MKVAGAIRTSAELVTTAWDDGAPAVELMT